MARWTWQTVGGVEGVELGVVGAGRASVLCGGACTLEAVIAHGAVLTGREIDAAQGTIIAARTFHAVALFNRILIVAGGTGSVDDAALRAFVSLVAELSDGSDGCVTAGAVVALIAESFDGVEPHFAAVATGRASLTSSQGGLLETRVELALRTRCRLAGTQLAVVTGWTFIGSTRVV
jgi:hypothetical protein